MNTGLGKRKIGSDISSRTKVSDRIGRNTDTTVPCEKINESSGNNRCY